MNHYIHAKYYLILLLWSLTLGACQRHTQTATKSIKSSQPLVAETTYFQFYSDFWVNLHHFLYQKAKGSQEQPLMDFSEEEIINALSTDERAILDKSIAYYTQNVIQKDILFNDTLVDIKVWLRQLPETTIQVDSVPHMRGMAQIWNTFAPIYQQHYWTHYDKINREKINKHLTTIQKIEGSVAERLMHLTKERWAEKPMRVDVSVYANWAGGYTTVYPKVHVIISSAHQRTVDDLWVELVFHEASHALVSPNRKIGQVLTAEAKAMNKELPRGEWHAILFYLVGKTVQNHLKKEGINQNKIYMEQHNVFKRLATDSFIHALELYMNGEKELEETMKAIVRDTE